MLIWHLGLWLLCCLQVPNLVGVPTHFFKVVLAESKSRNLLGAKPVGATGSRDRAARPQSYCARPRTQKHAQWADVSCDVIMQTVVGAFVMPNAPIDPDMPLTSFTVPLEALESASGLRFFPVRTQHLYRFSECIPCCK
jgi:DNA/RNA endonuclease G (NUC1)